MIDNSAIFVISSQVVSGQVGLKAIMPALRTLSFEAITLPTTLLGAHPAAFRAMGTPVGGALPAEQLQEMADWLLKAGALDNCAAILSGYLPSPAHVAAVAKIVTCMKREKPDLIYACDPICGDIHGDTGRLYLPETVVAGLRDHLLPLADIASPNLFELQCLAGSDNLVETNDAITAARHLGVRHVIVTSAPAPRGQIANLAIGEEVYRCETSKAPDAPHGMGDFFAALYLGLRLNKKSQALGIASATMAQIAGNNIKARTLPHGPISLAAPAIQEMVFISNGEAAQI